MLQSVIKNGEATLHVDRYKGEFEEDDWIATFPCALLRLTGFNVTSYKADGKIGTSKVRYMIMLADGNSEEARALDLIERVTDILDGHRTRENGREIEVTVMGGEYIAYKKGIEVYGMNIECEVKQ